MHVDQSFPGSSNRTAPIHISGRSFYKLAAMQLLPVRLAGPSAAPRAPVSRPSIRPRSLRCAASIRAQDGQQQPMPLPAGAFALAAAASLILVRHGHVQPRVHVVKAQRL